MPEIPTLTSQVNPNVTPGGSAPMVSAASFGESVGQTLSVGGEVASKIYHERVTQIDQSVALDAHNQKNDFNQAKLFGKDGILNQNTGKDAPGAVDKFMSDYDQNTAKIAASLSNDNQRQSFARLSQENRYQVQNHLNNYETHQVDGYHEQVTHAAVSSSVVSAVQGIDSVLTSPDPKLANVATRNAAIDAAVKDHTEIGEAAIRDNEARKNTPKEVVDAKVAEYQSQATYAVIQSLTSKGKDEDAAAYYEANKKKLTGQEAVHAANVVTDGTTFGDASRVVDSTAYDKEGKLRDRSEVESDLLKTPKYQTNERYAAAVDRQLDRRYRIAHQVEQKEQGDILSASQKVLIENGGDLDSLKAINPDAWEKLNGGSQESLVELSRKIGKRELPPSGSAGFVKMNIMAGDQTKGSDGLTGEDRFNAMSSSQLYSLATEMSAEDHAKLVTMWKKGNATDEKNDDITGVRNFSAIAKASLSKAGLPFEATTTSPGTGTAIYHADTDKVLSVVSTDIEAWKLDNPTKKHVPPEIIQKAFDNALLKNAETKQFHAMEVPSGTIANIKQADPAKKAAAIAYLTANKRIVNDGTVLSAYNAMRNQEANPTDIQKELREKKRKSQEAERVKLENARDTGVLSNDAMRGWLGD